MEKHPLKHQSVDPVTIIKKLDSRTLRWTAAELDTLLWMLIQDSPDSRYKGEFALNLTFKIDAMINELAHFVDLDARKKPTYNSRLLPIYDTFFDSLKSVRSHLFFDVCKSLLKESWYYSCAYDDEPPDNRVANQHIQPEFQF